MYTAIFGLQGHSYFLSWLHGMFPCNYIFRSIILCRHSCVRMLLYVARVLKGSGELAMLCPVTADYICSPYCIWSGRMLSNLSNYMRELIYNIGPNNII